MGVVSPSEWLAKDLSIPARDPDEDMCPECRAIPGAPHAPGCIENHMAVSPPVFTREMLDASIDNEDADLFVGRYFETGAYRDTDEGKPDYEGYLSPLVIVAFGEYMLKHQRQSDGRMRDSDNWQKGIPLDQYMKSAWRHLLDLWLEHRCRPSREGLDEALGGLLFNVMGYWHELLTQDDPEV